LRAASIAANLALKHRPVPAHHVVLTALLSVFLLFHCRPRLPILRQWIDVIAPVPSAAIII
jgi:hypothetical protein